MPFCWLTGILVFFQVEVGKPLLENTNQDVVGKLVLGREARGGDGLKTAEEGPVGLVALGDSSQ